MPRAKAQETEIQILEMERGVVEFNIVGTTPIILNSMSEKAWHELLFPKGKKTAAERAGSLKHNPIEEFRAASDTMRLSDAPTLLAASPIWFKKGLCNAALDIPGAQKSQLGRLCYVVGEQIPLFGVPKLFMSVTRSADMNRTPDIRTRAILPQWACRVAVTYAKPILRAQGIANLLAAAGMFNGAGDWRQQKGSGSYGQYRLADATDPEFEQIVSSGGRSDQLLALATPECYDEQSAKMLAWFTDEFTTRGFKEMKAPARKVEV